MGICYGENRPSKNRNNNSFEKGSNCPTSNNRDISSDNFTKESTDITPDNNNLPSYMNVAIQCLLNTKKLTNYFLTRFEKYLNKKDNLIISKNYYFLLKNLLNKENYKNESDYSSYNFKNKIYKEFLLKNPNQINDCKDLIIFILESIHLELNKANNFFFINDENNNIMDLMDKNKIFNKFLIKFKNNYKSIISDLFYGIKEIKYKCNICTTIKYNYDIFFFLEFSLEKVSIFFNKSYEKKYVRFTNEFIPEINLSECFEYYQREETMDRDKRIYCQVCKTNCNTNIYNSLYSLPQYLIIILNRGEKNQFKCKVNIPKSLNLEEYTQFKGVKYEYDLYGVIYKTYIDSNFEHIKAFYKNINNNKWYLYKDNNISECEINNDSLNKDSYILFYQKKEDL